MKELENYCCQHRAYQNCYGRCVVQLEDGETVDDIRAKYFEPDQPWWAMQYSNLVKLDSVVINGVTYTDRVYQMDTERVYLD